jgi:hypothetical protein
VARPVVGRAEDAHAARFHQRVVELGADRAVHRLVEVGRIAPDVGASTTEIEGTHAPKLAAPSVTILLRAVGDGIDHVARPAELPAGKDWMTMRPRISPSPRPRCGRSSAPKGEPRRRHRPSGW